MKVKLLAAVDLLITLGYKTANKWEYGKIAEKLGELKNEITDKTGMPTRAGQKELLEKILHTDETIRVVDGDGKVYPENKASEKSEKKTEKKPETKTAPKKAPAKKETKAKKAPAEKGKGKDKFGSRIGSNNAKVNSCLTATPKTMAELVKEARIEGTVYTHIGELIEAGYVARTDKGFKLIKTPK